MTQTIKSTIGVLSRLRQGQRMNGVANRKIQETVKSINDHEINKRELRRCRLFQATLAPVALAHTHDSGWYFCLKSTYQGSR